MQITFPAEQIIGHFKIMTIIKKRKTYYTHSQLRTLVEVACLKSDVN